MSTNIHFLAEREIIVVKTGQKDIQRIYFNSVWQTPSRVTRELMDGDPIQGYKDWILRECSHDEILAVYADDDYFEERAPVGQRIYNSGKEHVDAFEEWLDMCEQEGYTVTAEAW